MVSTLLKRLPCSAVGAMPANLAHRLCSSALAFAWLVGSPCISNAASDSKLKVLLLVEGTHTPLQVEHMSDGDIARGALVGGGLAGWIIMSAGSAMRNDALAKQLNRTIGEFDRTGALQQAIKRTFDSKTGVQVVIGDGHALLNDGKLDRSKVRSTGCRFVLKVIDQMSGLTMLDASAIRNDKLFPVIELRYSFIDAEKDKILLKGTATGYALQKMIVKDAVNNRSLFCDNYEAMATSAANFIFGRLYQSDQLHAAAKSLGLGDTVQAFGSILKKYEDRFRISLVTPKGWRLLKGANAFSKIIEPKSDDRLRFGIRWEADLLIPEFGQNVSSIQEYIAIVAKRLGDSGYDLTTFKVVPEFAGVRERLIFELALPENRGKQFLIYRKVDELFVEAFVVTFLGESDSLYGKYHSQIEEVINGSRFTRR